MIFAFYNATSFVWFSIILIVQRPKGSLKGLNPKVIYSFKNCRLQFRSGSPCLNSSLLKYLQFHFPVNLVTLWTSPAPGAGPTEAKIYESCGFSHIIPTEGSKSNRRRPNAQRGISWKGQINRLVLLGKIFGTRYASLPAVVPFHRPWFLQRYSYIGIFRSSQTWARQLHATHWVKEGSTQGTSLLYGKMLHRSAWVLNWDEAGLSWFICCQTCSRFASSGFLFIGD